jgi:4-amino-4-deoxy-L-arabinose transferase-like glycosyltransferase
MSIRRFQKAITDVILLVCIIAVSATVFTYRIKEETYHNDENFWLYYSRYFRLFFLDRNISSPEWNNIWAMDPPIGKYYVGLAVWMAGLEDKISNDLTIKLGNSTFDMIANWNSTGSWTAPYSVVTVPRIAIAISGIMTCIVVYFIGKLMSGRVTGFAAAMTLAANPLMIQFSKRVLTAVPTLMFSSAVILSLMLWYKSRKSSRENIAAVFTIGFLLAMSVGTKQSGIFAAGTFVLFMLELIAVAVISDKGNRVGIIKNSAIILAASSVLALAVFFITNPFLYNQPPVKFSRMNRYRLDAIRYQQEKFGPALYNAGDRLKYTFSTTFIPNKYAILGNSGLTVAALGLFITGFIVLIAGEIRHIRSHHVPGSASIVILFTVVTYAGMILFLPLAWEGYTIPLVIPTAIVTGYGAARVWSVLQMTIRRICRQS